MKPGTVLTGEPLSERADPRIIQGGMGVRVSSWSLAWYVSIRGELGVVSGTALEHVLAAELNDGRYPGPVKEALDALVTQIPALGEDVSRIVGRYFRAGGRGEGQSYATVPRWSLMPSRELQVLTLAANFVEVYLAKRGHTGLIGINYLRKIEMPLPWAIYGALLAGADYILMGAGNPGDIPELIERLRQHEDVSWEVKVQGESSGNANPAVLTIRPSELTGGKLGPLRKPKFLAIVSQVEQAAALSGNPRTRPYGFVVETPDAGGHNAPARGAGRFEGGRMVPHYTEIDYAMPADFSRLGLPFWMGGAYGTPEKLREVLAAGATGVQVGTLFALCRQSGMDPKWRERVLELLAAGELEVVRDARLSPTGFPFEVAKVEGSISDESVRAAREPVCDIGYLRIVMVNRKGERVLACPAMPRRMYLEHGGRERQLEGRGCLCNALLSTAGFPRIRPGGKVEAPVITLGHGLDSVREVQRRSGRTEYSAGDVVSYLRGESRPVSMSV